MSFRNEKKFRLSISDSEKIKDELLIRGMKVLFPSRKINSCYYDTNNLKMLEDSNEGILPRKKIRVRWYNENNFKKEVKISSMEGRFKTSNLIKFSSNLSYIKNTFFYDINYGKLVPSLIINYDREYFNFKNLRITFDKNIIYRNLRSLDYIAMKDFERVMEIKSSKAVNDDYIQNIFNYHSSRFSKYSRGFYLTINS